MRLLIIAAFCLLPSLSWASANFEFQLERGPQPVGMRLLQQYDYARVYRPRYDMLSGQPVQGERARPVQTLVWYPAQAGGKPLHYIDYLRTELTEEDYTQTPAQLEQKFNNWIAQRGIAKDKELLRQITEQPMWAVRDAKPAAGRYPVVVYAPSFNASAHENVDLCEYLASQGYIVLSSPDMGARTRSMTDDLEGIEAQASDIRFLISTAQTLPQADTSKVAVVGFSWGGISNVFAAARDDRIRALVSLDGSIRYYPELVDGSAKAAKYVTPERVPVPFMFIAARPKSIEKLASSKNSTNYSFINNMKYADTYLLSMQPMVHGDFSAAGLRLTIPDAAADYSRAEVLTAYNWSLRYVGQFLNAYLKEDQQALAFLQKPATQNGSPRHLMTIEQRKASAKPPSFENLALELRQRGYTHAQEVYERMKQADSTFSIGEPQMNLWGYELQRVGYVKDAIEALKLAVSVYPNSGNLYDSLAEMYEIDGQKPLAIVNYRRSLELDPANANAVQHLKGLEQ
ncbi:dienelactone hydrolase [Duganella sp. FT80W]|uniref:Dienelactone hydrolase n=1 Tax=Duganella guangzhouensis TaxID=2666084 RepID=A0A6I2L568_9BURK|nr:dienelactone hydrolase family protein [Duganella guangzhouensis]MRW92034.1 dienelactone hydrolase [Duganella guangzhouensis]